MTRFRLLFLTNSRFSDILSDASSVLPGAAYERDPTVDYDIHKAALYTMATCHSLRLVEDDLVGDPLDYKMFEFTGWSFEEGGQKSGHAEDGEYDKLSPSIARPPVGMEYGIDETDRSTPVCYPFEQVLSELIIEAIEIAHRVGYYQVL